MGSKTIAFGGRHGRSRRRGDDRRGAPCDVPSPAGEAGAGHSRVVFSECMRWNAIAFDRDRLEQRDQCDRRQRHGGFRIRATRATSSTAQKTAPFHWCCLVCRGRADASELAGSWSENRPACFRRGLQRRADPFVKVRAAARNSAAAAINSGRCFCGARCNPSECRALWPARAPNQAGAITPVLVCSKGSTVRQGPS